jgi:hypothetical protein
MRKDYKNMENDWPTEDLSEFWLCQNCLDSSRGQAKILMSAEQPAATGLEEHIDA